MMHPKTWSNVAADERRLVLFGFIAAFTSSFGQTYFIGVFGPEIQAEFGLSYTDWGAIYLLGTLLSAVLLPFSGKLIDHLPLRRFSLYVCGLLLLASSSTFVVTGWLTLVLSIFLLRHAGQGLMSHIAITTVARYFKAGRGRAIAIASLGYSAGEAMLPFLAVLAIAIFGWRWTYGGVALFLGLVIVPVFLRLLKAPERRPSGDATDSHKLNSHQPGAQRSWTRAEVLADRRIYLLLPALLAPPIVSTAMFFHHLTLADAKGWGHAWITGSYAIYAAVTVVTTLITGPLIDRIGAIRIVPFMLIPMILAMVAVAVFSNPLVVWLYMVLMGINIGMVHTSVSAMWPELYGVQHLGAIRSLTTAIGVFGTALGPVTMGGLIDMGFGIDVVCLFFAAYSVIGTGLMVAAFKHPVD